MTLSRLLSPFRLLIRLLSVLFGAVFGKLAWQPPSWIRWLCRKPATAAVILAVTVAAGVGGWYGWHWYQLRPLPHTVDYRTEPPAPTQYEKTPVVVSPLVIRFTESVAPLNLVGKPVTTGLRLRPELAGSWNWRDDRTLEFKPDSDWPVGVTFTLAFSPKECFAPGVLLSSSELSFSSAPFTATITQNELYQDPTDNTLKKLVADITFSHPVDTASLNKAVAIKLGPGLSFRNETKEPWTVSFDKTNLHAYIHSAALAIPLEAAPITLALAKGISAAKGGPPTTQNFEQTVMVPGRYQLTFSTIETRYVANQQGEPEQMLMLDSLFPIRDETISRHVHAWLLPEKKEGWRLATLNESDLKKAEPLVLKHIPSAEPLNSHHSFAFHAPIKRQIVVKIDANVEAVGGYLSKKEEITLLNSGEYPKVLKLMGDGALLSLKGEKKIGFMAQGVPAVKMEIARLLPGQLHQIIDQNYSGFAKPSVYGSSMDRLVERMEWTKTLGPTNPAKPVYDALDLSTYLDSDQGRRGVFILRLTPFDPAQPQRDFGEMPYGPETGDRRFILVTDLGLISKTTLDGGQEVFVQSLATGTPVAGAEVAILGRNGLAVATAQTDEHGHARFPQMNQLRREKQPIMVVASQGEDMSFLPLQRNEHQLDFSRFDVSGVTDAKSPDQLSASLFTDRGLYRPGETAHIGFIVRTADWSARLEGMPLELEITDPRGLVAWQQHRKCTGVGFDALDFTSGEAAPAGEYTASIYLVKNNRRDLLLGSTVFTVREFEPDRLKVDLRLAEAPVTGWVQPEAVKVQVKARHLFGADAADRRVSGSMQLRPASPAFKQFPQYRFHTDTVLKEHLDEDLAESKTSASGEAELLPNLQRFAQATYTLRVTAKVFEAEGGRNVTASQEVLVSAAPYLLGVACPDSLDYVSKGAERTTKLLALNAQLQPLAIEELKAVLIEYRYVSVLVKQANGTYTYESRRKEVVRTTIPVDLPAEGKEIALPTQEPGDFAYEFRDGQGSVRNRIAWTVAGTGNLSRSLERNAELQIKLDKASYLPGEPINISLRAPYTGSGLITIERDKVYAHQWFKADTTSTVQTITVPKELEGNGYINVQFVRDPNSAEVFMSPLSSGVAPFTVSLDARKLPLSVQSPSLVEPGQELTLKIVTGEAAKAVVFAVDEGILQVARYKTPDPLGSFFQKRALSVQTSQILSLLLPEFSRLLQASAPGGDGEEELGAHLNPFKRKRQGAVAYWSGVVDIPPEGRTLAYTVPNRFNGRLRLMAIAVTAGRIGTFESATEVRGPWILTPNMPAFVAPGDEFTLTAGVFNNVGQRSDVAISLKTCPGLSAVENTTQHLTLEPGQEGLASFRMRATPLLGSCDLTLAAESSGGHATVTESISIRPASPYRVALQAGLFQDRAFSLQRQRDLYPEYSKISLGYDRSPLIWLQGLHTYLEQYPYGCTEQLLSKAMPTLILTPPSEREKTGSKALNTALTTLRQRQSEEGGFGQWASNLEVHPDVSVYAADFLLEAKERGYEVPKDLEQLSRKYLEAVANGPAEGMEELRIKARAVYLLTRQGIVTTRALAAVVEQLEKHHQHLWRSDLAAAYLAASQSLLKHQAEAKSRITAVPWRMLATAKAEAEETVMFDDPLTHDAELLTLLARHFPEVLPALPASVLSKLGEQLSQDRFHSFSAALLIRAFDLYGQSMKSSSGALEAVVVDQSGKETPLALQGGLTQTSLKLDWATVVLRKEQADSSAFYQLTEAGFDRNPPAEPSQQGIEIVREYLNKSGQPVSQLKVGEEMTVRLRMRATERDALSEIAVVDLLPGGTEPVVTVADEETAEEEIAAEEDGSGNDTVEEQQKTPGWEPFFVDTRDDRVVVYTDLSRDVATYEYTVRATNAGVYITPPPYAEGMYERRLQGRGAGGSLTIVAP